MYQITDPTPNSLFGNRKEKVKEKGFRARVSNRDDEVRSFRYEGIVAMV